MFVDVTIIHDDNRVCLGQERVAYNQVGGSQSAEMFPYNTSLQ